MVVPIPGLLAVYTFYASFAASMGGLAAAFPLFPVAERPRALLYAALPMAADAHTHSYGGIQDPLPRRILWHSGADDYRLWTHRFGALHMVYSAVYTFCIPRLTGSMVAKTPTRKLLKWLRYETNHLNLRIPCDTVT